MIKTGLRTLQNYHTFLSKENKEEEKYFIFIMVIFFNMLRRKYISHLDKGNMSQILKAV